MRKGRGRVRDAGHCSWLEHENSSHWSYEHLTAKVIHGTERGTATEKRQEGHSQPLCYLIFIADLLPQAL